MEESEGGKEVAGCARGGCVRQAGGCESPQWAARTQNWRTDAGKDELCCVYAEGRFKGLRRWWNSRQ